MSRPEKTFDAVAMMRSIRERISAEIQGMTLEQELAWPALPALHPVSIAFALTSAANSAASSR